MNSLLIYFHHQRDLEYDPALYQRDRGELDSDARSIAATEIFGKPRTHHPNMSSNALKGYLGHGPGTSDIELTKMDSMEEPLLSPTSAAFQAQAFASQHSLPASLYQRSSRGEAPLHRPQDRAYSPSPAYASTDNLGRSPVSPYPSSEQSHQSYLSPAHQRQTSGNMLANQPARSQSPGPYNAMGYPPQQQSQQYHARQASGNMLASGRSQSPGPYNAYAPQQQHPQHHARQSSGNVLAEYQRSPATPAPGYQQAPPGLQSQPAQHQQQPQQDNTNMAGRGARRGGY